MNDNDDTSKVGSGRIGSSSVRVKEESDKAGLIVEPDGSDEGEAAQDSFSQQLAETLKQTEDDVRELGVQGMNAGQSAEWHEARSVVEKFRPVPWFIWRLANYVLSEAGKIRPISEGMVLGLRRLLFAAASDEVLQPVLGDC